MTKVDVANARAVITDEVEGLRIRIPTQRNWFTMFFVGFWLGGWGVGEVLAAQLLIEGRTPKGTGKIFLVAWLGAWTVGGFAALRMVLWMAFGAEVILVRQDSLVIRKLIFGLGSTREYSLGDVKNLRVLASDDQQLYAHRRGRRMSRLNVARVSFDYGSKSFRFGNGVDEPEAVELVARIKPRLGL